MRTIEEIKAEIEELRSKCGPELLGEYENELRAALTADIPLDRLETICAADKDGRLLIVPTKPFEKAYVPRPLGDGIMEVEIQHYELCENGCCGVIKADGEWRFDISVIKATRESASAALEARGE